MFPDDFLQRNRDYAHGRQPEPLPAAEAIELAVVACYDPRLDALLRPALGLEPGEGFLLRTAGAVITPGGDTLRSLTLAVYLFGVRQVLVVGHTSCRMAQFPTTDFIDSFRRRGVARTAFGDSDLRTWAGAIASPRQGVLSSVAAIVGAPVLPSDLEVAGVVLDDESGELETVYRPGDSPALEVSRTAAGEQIAPSTETASDESVESAAEEKPLPALPAVPEADSPLVAVQEVLGELVSDHALREQLWHLRLALKKESNAIKQLVLLQRFIKRVAAESPELREAFVRLKRQASAAGPRAIAELIEPLLSGRHKR